jgi:predicted DNA-binding transcriptional regulator AlpA
VLSKKPSLLFPERQVLVSEGNLARALGKDQVTLWRWRKTGQMPQTVRTASGTIFYRCSDIEGWIARQVVTPEQELVDADARGLQPNYLRSKRAAGR